MYISRFSYRRYWCSIGMSILGCLLIGGYLFLQSESDTEVDTVWIIDTSLSMMVEDIIDPVTHVVQSRLDTAKYIIQKGISQIPGDHAILTYARSAGVLAPLGHDHTFLLSAIEGIIPTVDNGGSDVSMVFTLFDKLYVHHPRPIRVILLTDGGDTSDTPLPHMSTRMSISVIGIGTLSGGPIPLGYDASGLRRYKIYAGKEVTSPYNASFIETLRHQLSASVSHITSLSESYDLDLSSTMYPLLTDSLYRALLGYIGGALMILALFLHPYARLP